MTATTLQELEQLQRTEAAEYDAALRSWIEQKRAAGVEEITAEEVFGEDMAAGAMLTPLAWPDAAGNYFEGITLNSPLEYAEQAVVYVRYMSADGNTVLREVIVYCDGGRKADGMTAMQIGDKLHIYPTGHQLQSGVRRNALDRAIWAVGAAPYGPGARPKTGAALIAPPPPAGSFTDVPPESPFFSGIERLYAIGAIGGYPCGGPNEPCDPQNRPYFRPGNSPTRGQLAKILGAVIAHLEG